MSAATPATMDYLSAIDGLLGRVLAEDGEVIALAGEAIARCFDADGILCLLYTSDAADE